MKNGRRWWIEFLVTGFYIGKIPWMPGTFGTLWGVIFAWAFMQAGPYLYMLFAIILIFASSALADLYERNTTAHDPSEVVIDEICGYVIAMTWLPHTWQSFLGAFLFFRFFDILKPWPISFIDAKAKGGLGTVLDDVAAGIVSNIVLQIIYTNTSLLGVRLPVGQ